MFLYKSACTFKGRLYRMFLDFNHTANDGAAISESQARFTADA